MHSTENARRRVGKLETRGIRCAHPAAWGRFRIPSRKDGMRGAIGTGTPQAPRAQGIRRRARVACTRHRATSARDMAAHSLQPRVAAGPWQRRHGSIRPVFGWHALSLRRAWGRPGAPPRPSQTQGVPPRFEPWRKGTWMCVTRECRTPGCGPRLRCQPPWHRTRRRSFQAAINPGQLMSRPWLAHGAVVSRRAAAAPAAPPIPQAQRPHNCGPALARGLPAFYNIPMRRHARGRLS